MGFECKIKSVIRVTVLAWVVLLSGIDGFGQSESRLDSLQDFYETGDYNEYQELKILEILSTDIIDPQQKLDYSLQLIEVATSLDSLELQYVGLLHKGNALRMKSDLTLALVSYLDAAKIAEKEGMNRNFGRVNIAIADVYSIRGNHNNAVLYYQKAINLLQLENDSLGIATAFENLGDEFLNVNMPDSAMTCFAYSGAIYKALDYKEGIAANLGNKGIAFAELGQHDSAKVNINKAVTQLEMMDNFYPISVYLTYMSDIYLNQDNRVVSLAYASRSLEIAEKYGLKDQISDANLKLSELHELFGNYQKSLDHYQEYETYKDSVRDINSVQQMANLRTEFEVAQKQTEVDLLNEQKKTQASIVIGVTIALILICLLAIALFRRNRFIHRTKKIIEKERDRSDRLLLNILPEETAHELKESGKVKARKFDSVTVLFADFKGFTFHSEKLTPEQLVKSVDYYFSKFDSIIDKYGLEKIKTMGDAYMCASGLPFPCDDHACKVTQAAFEMTEFVEVAKQNRDPEIAHFEIRIGINTGPVVAGVVGTKKFVYDIWGDTVNIAARMESNSQPGKINISHNTYLHVMEQFTCSSRGEIDVKNKGMMQMYFVSRHKSSDTDTFKKESVTVDSRYD